MPDGEAAFLFCGPGAAASLQDVQRHLTQAWRLISASQIDQALTVVEAIEQQLDNLSSPAATRCRAESYLVRLAVLAFQDHSLAVLAIVVSEAFVERGAGMSPLSMETFNRAEKFEPALEPALRKSGSGSKQLAVEGDAITSRERDVLSMIGQGCSNKHIARSLKISPETVKSHVKRIFWKLSVNTRTEAVFRALSLRLL